MGEDILAQIRHHAFPHAGNEIVAQGRGDCHDQRHGTQNEKPLVQHGDIARAEPLVDQLLGDKSHGGRGRRRQQQEDDHGGAGGLLPPEVGNQPYQRPQVARLATRACRLADVSDQFGAGTGAPVCIFGLHGS